MEGADPLVVPWVRGVVRDGENSLPLVFRPRALFLCGFRRFVVVVVDAAGTSHRRQSALAALGHHLSTVGCL